MKREPWWVVAFLRALERTGEARTAAKDAGIDHTTAYARRKAHPDFAAAWAEALEAHRARVKAEEEAEIEALKNRPSHPSPSRGCAAGPSLSLKGRGAGDEEFTVSGGKVRRVGHGRWGKEKERIFFEVLAGTANMQTAAAAAGVSTNTILTRRQKSRLFAAKFDAVVENAKAVIDLYLVEEARKTFDPDTLDTGDVRPKVTIDQAIKISQRSKAKSRRADPEADPFADDAAETDDDGIDAIKEGILGKLHRIRESDRREQIALGWTLDESFDVMIPPGYIKGPD